MNDFTVESLQKSQSFPISFGTLFLPNFHIKYSQPNFCSRFTSSTVTQAKPHFRNLTHRSHSSRRFPISNKFYSPSRNSFRSNFPCRMICKSLDQPQPTPLRRSEEINYIIFTLIASLPLLPERRWEAFPIVSFP